MVLSPLPEARYFPSGEKATANTSSVCPRNVWVSWARPGLGIRSNKKKKVWIAAVVCIETKRFILLELYSSVITRNAGLSLLLAATDGLQTDSPLHPHGSIATKLTPND